MRLCHCTTTPSHTITCSHLPSQSPSIHPPTNMPQSSAVLFPFTVSFHCSQLSWFGTKPPPIVPSSNRRNTFSRTWTYLLYTFYFFITRCTPKLQLSSKWSQSIFTEPIKLQYCFSVCRGDQKQIYYKLIYITTINAGKWCCKYGRGVKIFLHTSTSYSTHKQKQWLNTGLYVW